ARISPGIDLSERRGGAHAARAEFAVLERRAEVRGLARFAVLMAFPRLADHADLRDPRVQRSGSLHALTGLLTRARRRSAERAGGEIAERRERAVRVRREVTG